MRPNTGPILTDPRPDVATEVLALEVAAEHVPRFELADAEIRGDPLALHFHSSAPLRHTYTKAIISSTTNTIVSISANVPNARSWTAIGKRKMTSISNRMNSIATR